jgi:phosphoribosylformylglycinamidine synthase
MEKIIAGHDISAGGMIVTLLEMCFANREGGIAEPYGDRRDRIP